MNIAEVIGWKFNNQPGMECEEVEGTIIIIKFPGGIPSQADQDTWVTEYETYITGGGLLDEQSDFEANFDPLLKAFALVLLDEVNLLRLENGLSQRTLSQLKNAIKNKL